jgi:predicted GNAT family N-acyltransferase
VLDRTGDIKEYLLYQGGTPIGTIRSNLTDKGYKIQRVAILQNHRSNKSGSFMLTKLLDLIKKERQNKDLFIYCEIQATAKNFFEKNGFDVDENIYKIVGIDHYYAEYKE